MSCTVDDCIKPVHGRGLCGMHYYRWKTRGDHSELALLFDSDGPPVCLCPTPTTGGEGQCERCWKPIVSLHPVLAPAYKVWPELASQVVSLPGRAEP